MTDEAPTSPAALRPRSIAWYGKLPWRGDFVGRGLPPAWQREWDDWLQRGIAAAARRLGAQAWRQRFAAMTPWQCLAVPLEEGGAWSWATIAPSTDRVGRAFPILFVESYDAPLVQGAALSALRERGTNIADWLVGAARECGSMKEFERSAAHWAVDGWDGATEQLEDVGISVAALRELWPQAATFWWPARADPFAPPLAEAWPPRDALVQEWLGSEE